MPTAADASVLPYRPDHAAAWRSLNEDWLRAGGYALEAVTAVDQFKWTAHVETVAIFRR